MCIRDRLNIIAGLEQQTEGKVVYNGREWKGVNPEISMVFQKLALMPFKTVSYTHLDVYKRQV